MDFASKVVSFNASAAILKSRQEQAIFSSLRNPSWWQTLMRLFLNPFVSVSAVLRRAVGKLS